MNEFDQISFYDYKLIVEEDVDEELIQEEDEYDVIEDLISTDEMDIYKDSHVWDWRATIQMRFYPRYWRWYPHELYV